MKERVGDEKLIMPKVRWTYNGRLIYKTSYGDRRVFLRYDRTSHLQNRKIVWDIVRKLANDIHKRTLSAS